MPRINLCALVLLFVLSSVWPVVAANDIPQQVADLQGKTLLIRGFYENDRLEYDSSGNVVGEPNVGSWTTAMFKIKHIERTGFLELEGSRVYLEFDDHAGVFRPVNPKKEEPIRVTIELDSASFPPEKLAASLERIFVRRLNPQQDLPEYWHEYFANFHPHRIADTSIIDRSHQLREEPALREARGVSMMEPGTTPPRVIYKQDPNAQQKAKHADAQGTSLLDLVLDANGLPTHLQIERPIGLGLDDKAIEAAKNWRFTPAMRKGKRVTVRLNIEVDFRLY